MIELRVLRGVGRPSLRATDPIAYAADRMGDAKKGSRPFDAEPFLNKSQVAGMSRVVSSCGSTSNDRPGLPAAPDSHRELLMKFLHYDLGYVASGSTAVVRLSGTEANVLLLDDHNLARYRRGESYDYRGGHYQASPVRLHIPSSGRWTVVVDLGGYAGSVDASVQVIAA